MKNKNSFGIVAAICMLLSVVVSLVSGPIVLLIALIAGSFVFGLITKLNQKC